MKKAYTQAFKALKKLGCPVFIHPDAPSRFDISAEDENSCFWADYYEGMYYEGWEFGVNPKVGEILRKHGLYAEWVNPGHLRVCEI